MTSSARDIWDRALECLIRRPPAAEQMVSLTVSAVASSETNAITAEQLLATMRRLEPRRRRRPFGPVYERTALIAFRNLLHSEGTDPRPLEALSVRVLHETNELEFRASCGHRSVAWRIDGRDSDYIAYVMAGDHLRELAPHYDRLRTDHLIELELRSHRENLRHLREMGANVGEVYRLQRAIFDLEQRLRAQHAPPPRFPNYAVDPTRRGPVSFFDGEVDNYSYLRVHEVYGHSPAWLSSRELHGTWITDEQIDAANKKALALLHEWLTPEQAVQYKEHQHFEVMGSDTGKRYRICHGSQMNVYELGNNGKPVRGHCFTPEGGLAAGDAMLAQKVALETFELEALAKANVFHAYDGVAQYVSMGQAALRERVWLAADWIGS